jgi:hypothetical protein
VSRERVPAEDDMLESDLHKRSQTSGVSSQIAPSGY